ncbi:hypothetical protein GCM10008983_00360 [Lentibacillus halophilus]|uniref:YutG/PgpA domain-containing protein n=1 Tax=Lentibacillus halophilus TaxID=295065 RepID=A0ABN0Z104_9BACI
MISLDTFIEFLSGLAIFPAFFAFQMEPNTASGLLFLTILTLLDQIPFGYGFGLVFFVWFAFLHIKLATTTSNNAIPVDLNTVVPGLLSLLT